MTTTDLTDLSPEQLRNILCECLEWEYDEATDNVFFTDADGNICGHLWESLDSMHEAEATLTYEEAERFDDELCDICKRDNDKRDNPMPWRFAVMHATAAQRLAAFLIVKGLATQ